MKEFLIFISGFMAGATLFMLLNTLVWHYLKRYIRRGEALKGEGLALVQERDRIAEELINLEEELLKLKNPS